MYVLMPVLIGKHFKSVLAKRKFKSMNNINDVSDAMDIMMTAMRNDPGYAYSWHANLAMMYRDAMPDVFWLPDDSELHKIANDGASRFMKIAFGIETSQDMLDER